MTVEHASQYAIAASYSHCTAQSNHQPGHVTCIAVEHASHLAIVASIHTVLLTPSFLMATSIVATYSHYTFN